MPKFKNGDVELYYETHGSGPALLLSHGYSATSQMWTGQIETLSRDHQLILWDMRGHGRSDYPDDQVAYSEDTTVSDMAALLHHLDVKRAIVGGLSLGGYMSLSFYAAHPERVTALLIIDTGPGFRKDEVREQWNDNAKKTAARYEKDGLGGRSASREVAISSHRSADGLAKAARGMLTQRDARVMNILPDIAVPSLVLVGANDTPFFNAADYMAAKIPHAKKVVIPDAGHASNIDQPEAFNAAVTAFLSSVPQS